MGLQNLIEELSNTVFTNADQNRQAEEAIARVATAKRRIVEVRIHRRRTLEEPGR